MPTRSVPTLPLALATLALGGFSQAVSSTPQPGSVQGQVFDTHGKPMAGVQVWIKPVVTTGVAETLTDEQGRYQVTGLPPVGYRAYAWVQAPYQGKTFCYRLAQPALADYSAFNPRDGLVRNFRWQLSGKIPGEEAYSDLGLFGGSLPLMAAFGQNRVATQDDQIEVTLTPVGPLIDGSTGQTLIRTAPARGMVLDVPIGTYRVKATFIGANGGREAIQVSAQDGDYTGEATVHFRPSGDICKGTTGGAPGRAYVYWKFQ